jgi:hypothetical protein
MAQLSGETLRPRLGLGASFNLELRGRIYLDFRFAMYMSIRPVILKCFPSIPDSTAAFETGEAGGIQPVNVWLG